MNTTRLSDWATTRTVRPAATSSPMSGCLTSEPVIRKKAIGADVGESDTGCDVGINVGECVGVGVGMSVLLSGALVISVIITPFVKVGLLAGGVDEEESTGLLVEVASKSPLSSFSCFVVTCDCEFDISLLLLLLLLSTSS